MPARFRSAAAFRLLLPLALALHPGGEPARADDEKIARAGDVLQVLIPVAGAGIALAARDWEGGAQFAGSFLTAEAVVLVTKFGVGRRRPEGNSRTSFPSGHTVTAFSGAAFIDTRYGHWLGVPAYAAATYVGVSRVITDKHFVSDVLGSVGFALFSNWAWVSPNPSWVKIAPTTIGDGGYGIGVSVLLGGDRDRWKPPPAPRPEGPAVWEGFVGLFEDVGFFEDLGLFEDETPGRQILLESVREGTSESTGDGELSDRPRYRFAMDLGAFVPRDDTFSLGRFGGSEVDFTRYKGSGTRNMFVSLLFDASIDARQSVALELTPFESRATGVPAAGLGSPGQMATGEARSNLYDVTALYGLRFDLGDRFHLTPALGLSYQYLDVTTELDLGGATPIRRKLEQNRLFPMPRLTLDWDLAPKLRLSAAGSGMSYGTAWTWRADARLRWQFDPRWDVGLGYSFAGFGAATAQLSRDFVADVAFLELGFSWGHVPVPNTRRERTPEARREPPRSGRRSQSDRAVAITGRESREGG